MNQRLFGKVLLVAAMIAMAAVFTVRAESARADTIYTITQNGVETPITPLTGTDSASTFFNYYNSSSHTGHELADKSVLFLYEDTVTNNVSLVIIHDAITGDPDGGSATWTIGGLPVGGTVLVSDDPGEFINGTGANVGKAFGTWNWLSAYTDGGVIYLLDDPAISTIPLNVTIDGTFNDGISEWVLFAGQGIDVPLEMTPGEPFNTVTLTSTGIDSDADGDGYHTVVIPGATEGIDCDDGNASFNPGASEIHGDLIDNDCDGDIDEVTDIEIEVKPDSDVNPLNLNGNGVVPIALIGSANLDVTQIDVSTVTAGATGVEASPVHGGHIEDVNGDGIDDIVFHFREGDLEIIGSAKQVVALFLNAAGTDGEPLSGQDEVRINPNNGKSKGKGGKGPK